MKILITTDLFRSTINGVVTSILNLEEELSRQGHEVRILTVSDTGKAYQEGNVWYLRSIPSGIYPGVRIPVPGDGAYRRELTEWMPDVVHSQCEFCTFSYGKQIAEDTGAVFIHTCHTLYEQYTKYIPMGKYLGTAAVAACMRWRLRPVNRIIAPTKKVERTFLSYGVQKKTAIIPTGIKLEAFTNPVSKEKLEKLREECGIRPGVRVALSLGRLGFEKQVDELLYGWKESEIPGEEAVLLIVGGGPAEASLRKLSEELGLSDKVCFYGMAEPKMVPMFYQMADLFVCASTSETQGLTYVEALASGLPLVCRRDPCLAGVLEHGINGYSFRERGELGSYVKEVLFHKEKQQRMSARSRELAKAFGTEAFGRAVNDLYKKEVRLHEGAFVFEESEAAIPEWNWTGYADAKRFP
ncbi:MAG: glycosyltransferase family 4 protein [Lachnospiraceae bacterium]|nr:glycosyltransferase family 4 protein [Lachnospiraceae bacterium]